MTKSACRPHVSDIVRNSRRGARFDPASIAFKGLATLLSGLLAFQPELLMACEP